MNNRKKEEIRRGLLYIGCGLLAVLIVLVLILIRALIGWGGP